MKTQAILLTIAAVSSAKSFSYGYTALHPFGYPYAYGYGAYPYGAYPYTAVAPAATLKTAEVKPVVTPYTLPAAPAVYAPAFTASQYHSQDELGQASYGYAHPGQAHSAYRNALGHVTGSYSYINPDGKTVQVNYIADDNGFRVASNNLPVAPDAPAVELPVAPKPVEDTPEVKMAKEEHFAAVAAAKARALAIGSEQEQTNSRRKRSVVTAHPYAFPYAYNYAYGAPYVSPLAYTAPLAYRAPVAYAAAPAIPAQPFREAELTKTVLNPGHAVAYRVD